MQPSSKSAVHACVVVPLAEGFEEIEALTVVDVLRRAEIPLATAAVGGRPGELLVQGAHGVTVKADLRIEDVDAEQLDLLVLPGDQPGTTNLLAEPRIAALARRVVARGKPVGAICAAPLVLHAAGLLEGRTATCYPGVKERMGGVHLDDAPVVVDGLVTTSRGVGTALDFALALVEQLRGAAVADRLARALLAERGHQPS